MDRRSVSDEGTRREGKVKRRMKEETDGLEGIEFVGCEGEGVGEDSELLIEFGRL